MARLRDGGAGPGLIVSREAEKQEIISWYRDRLAEAVPPEGTTYEPVKIGPTWQWSPESGWLLPEFTLGWDLLAWAGMWLVHKGKPWAYTMEQARFLLHYYAVDPAGDFESHSAVLQRMKGWGKDPLAATMAPMEMVGPVRFSHWDGDRPVGREEPNAWVQLVAVSQTQTQNTMKLLPGLIPRETRDYYGFQIGRLSMWALGDTRQAEAVTSSPLALEGGRPTLVVRNETQNWNSSNGGHDMDGVLEGNAAKRDVDAPARILDICNAYRPGEDSVGERTRDAWEGTQGDIESDEDHERPKFMDFGLLYDSLEAPPEAPLTAEAIPDVITAIRGDAVWLDTRKGGRIMKSILNPANPPSESRRKWYNQITGREDAFTTRQLWDAREDETLVLEPGEEVSMFLDCSKSDDATALMACRILDGALFTLGMWQKPPGKRGEQWIVPRHKVDMKVRETERRQRVIGFFADPGHALEDETKERFWDRLIDQWHRDFGRRFKVWPRKSGNKAHSVMFDMSDYANQEMFVDAVDHTASDIESGELIHDGDARLRNHMLNAIRTPTRAGLSIAKEHRMSKKKIDLAVAAIGARMVRRLYLNTRKKGGRTW